VGVMRQAARVAHAIAVRAAGTHDGGGRA
jgi:hypothetical protein